MEEIMLDDLKYISNLDKADALGIAEKQWQQLEYEFAVPQQENDVENIVFAGMGGSALSALISKSWTFYSKPFEIIRNYDIPSYVSDKTYFIASSYSGNTEETISALEQAENKGAKLAVITSGGQLAEIARQKNIPLVIIPKAEQPRYAVFYSLKALVSLIDSAGLLTNDKAYEQLDQTANYLQEAVKAWLPTVNAKDNLAKQIALDVVGNSAVIYAGPKMAPAAYKWKISFNENAKHVAWYNQYPEFNHNEFMGWTKQPVQKPYTVIDLISNLEHPRIVKRFDVSKRLLSGKRPEPLIVQIQGKDLLQQLLWTINLGDFATIYTALANNIDPAPVELIERLKASLDE